MNCLVYQDRPFDFRQATGYQHGTRNLICNQFSEPMRLHSCSNW